MEEIWKPIKGYEGFEVSNLGRVKSLTHDVAMPNGGFKKIKESIVKQYTSGY